MRIRKGRGTFWLVGAAVGASVVWSGTAHAYHTEKDRRTDFTAFTLQGGQVRLGLFQTEYGITDRLMVGTYTLPWFAFIVVDGFMPSAYVKWNFLRVGPFAMSGRLTYFLADFDSIDLGDVADEGAFKLNEFVGTLGASYILNDSWQINAEALWVQSFVSATATQSDVGETEAFGAGAQNNLQFSGGFEWRLSRVTALTFVARWAPIVTDTKVTATVPVDEATTADVEGQLLTSEASNAWLVQPGVALSWATFNLQVGVGYGDLFLPGMRLVAPQKTIVPDLGIFFRF